MSLPESPRWLVDMDRESEALGFMLIGFRV